MPNIKECFTSRYSDGWIIEADFSQLEIIVLAHLCKDEQLIDDIQSGKDMHTVRAAELFDKAEADVSKKERKIAKALSFQLQYGSGATNMAEKNNIPVETARKFINNYYSRYPTLKEWQTSVANDIDKSKQLIAEHTAKGVPKHRGVWVSETGRRYVFNTTDAPDWMSEKTSFKPTEIKNYPVQGTATGDIVPLVLGKIYRWLVTSKWKGKVLLVNTVHDSIMFDALTSDLSEVANFCREVKGLMEKAPDFYKEKFGVEFTLPLKVEVTYGESWKDQTVEVE